MGGEKHPGQTALPSCSPASHAHRRGGPPFCQEPIRAAFPVSHYLNRALLWGPSRRGMR